MSALDAAFLQVEDGAAHMHVGGVLVFEGDAPEYDELVASVAGRLDRLPRYRQRLAWPARGLLRPCWVDDPRFDAAFHVRHAGLPTPRGEPQLRELAGRLFGQPLDRDRPLWELHLVDGLRGGRFALIAKIHHALADGVSGVDIATLLLDVDPDTEPPQPRERDAPPPPSDAELLVEGAVEQARDTASALLGALRRPRATADTVLRAARQAPGLVAGATPTAAYNGKIGPHRRFAWVRASLDDVKQVKDRFGVTVNDVVLAAVTGALRRHLGRRGELPETVTAMVPVSTRLDDERGMLGNHISSMYVPLPTGEADPAERLARTAAAVAERKAGEQADAVGALTAAGDAALPALMGFVARRMASPRLFALTVTNIPGPPFVLHLLGRRLEDVFPLVPLARDHAIGIAVMSYQGRLDFGLLACADSVPDLSVLERDLRVSLEELRSLRNPQVSGASRRWSAHASPSAPPDPARRRGRHGRVRPLRT